MGVEALMAASTVTSAVGAYGQSSAQKNSLEYDAKVAANNAILANQQATLAIQNGQTQEGNQRLKTGQALGAQRAALAANGIDLGEGSATDILATTQFMGERDALTIKDNALREAWGYRTQAQNYTDASNAKKATADSISPGFAAATSLLGSATNYAKYNYNKKKVS